MGRIKNGRDSKKGKKEGQCPGDYREAEKLPNER